MNQTSNITAADEQKRRFKAIFDQYLAAGDDPNVAAAKALTDLRQESNSQASAQQPPSLPPRTQSSPPSKPPAAVAVAVAVAEEVIQPIGLLGVLSQAAKADSVTPLIHLVGQVFADPEQLTSHTVPDSSDQLIDLAAVREVYDFLANDDFPEGVDRSLRNSLKRLGTDLVMQAQWNRSNDVSRLRPILLAFEYPAMKYGDPELSVTLRSLCQALMLLPKPVADVFVAWVQAQGDEYLEELLGTMQMCVTLRVLERSGLANFSDVSAVVGVIGLLHRVNLSRPEKDRIEIDEFYNAAVSELATEHDEFLLHDYVAWRTEKKRVQDQMAEMEDDADKQIAEINRQFHEKEARDVVLAAIDTASLSMADDGSNSTGASATDKPSDMDVSDDGESTNQHQDDDKAMGEAGTKHDEEVGKKASELAKARNMRDDAIAQVRNAMTMRKHQVTTQKKSFCQYPFVLDPGSKARILQIEARLTQRDEYEQAMREQMVTGVRQIPYMVLRVRRDHLVNDAMDQISTLESPTEVKKPLKVQFVGEEGIDEGGVQKEFFLLMTRQLLDPSFGMFNLDPESRLLWFNPHTFEEPLKFELVGVLLGLAIYNGIILDVHFARVLYRRLLGETPKLSDLCEIQPTVGKGLRALLAHEPASEVEDVFGLSFEISDDVFGHKHTVELIKNGSDVAVTGENRVEFCKRYVEHMLVTAVCVQYDAFQRGFHHVCEGDPLRMFEAVELELLICGSTVLDFDQLEASATYEGFKVGDRVVREFWEVVHGLDDEHKKLLLQFATGSDRVPIRGLASLRLTISRNGPDSDRLPTSHTCFNHLLLPEYDTMEKLKERLMLALANAEGFGTL